MPAPLPVLKGRAFVFGDHINSDQILPVRYVASLNVDELKEHVMEGEDPTFQRKMAMGDFIVAGRNFGHGASREQAASALRYAGIGAVIAKSFAVAFKRNAINLGLIIIQCPQAVDAIEDGDNLSIDLDRHIISNNRSGESFLYEGFSPELEKIMRSGGLVEHVRKTKAE
jgi:3-isopropylmalate/(R)-2-methylmalate dehydratase small subunit